MRTPTSYEFKLLCKLEGDGRKIQSAVWSPKDDLIAIGYEDGSIRFWDISNKVMLLKELKYHKESVSSLGWSSNGHTIAAVFADKTICLFNVNNAYEIIHKFVPDISNVPVLVWSPNDEFINLAFTSGEPRQLFFQTYNIGTGQLENSRSVTTSGIAYTALSSDNQVLALVEKSSTIQVWDMKTLLYTNLNGHYGRKIYGVALSPDKTMLAVSTDNGTVQLWNMTTGQWTKSLVTHDRPSYSLSFVFNNQILASKSMDSTVRLWRCDTWEEVVEIKEAHVKGEEIELSFHPGSPILATFDDKNTSVRIWNFDIDKLLQAREKFVVSEEIDASYSSLNVYTSNMEIKGNPIFQKGSVMNTEILIGDGTIIHGNLVVANSIKDSFNTVESAEQVSDTLKELLKELSVAVGEMTTELSDEDAEDVAEDLKRLVEEATREKPKRKWWSVSVEGLTKAANDIGNIGKPVLDIIARVLPLLEKYSV